jgi:sulfur transfer complex TusBCD TusB component (DsrH family)
MFETEQIIDDPSRGRRAKFVDHHKYYVQRINPSYDEYTSGANRYDLSGPGAHWFSWGYYGHNIDRDQISITWQKDERTMLREASEKFYSENEVDNLLNIVESPQLVSYTRSLYDLIQSGIKAAVNPRKLLTSLRNNNSSSALREDLLRRGFKKSIKTISNLHLGYAFGVAPLVSDMRKLSKATASYKKQLAQRIKAAGTEQSVHVRCSGVVEDHLVPGNNGFDVGYCTGPDLGGYWTTTPQGDAVRTVSVKGIRTVRYSQDIFSRLDNLIARFGVTGPASYAWERIPFSFVVDWFVDLSGVLTSLDNALTGNTKKISEITVSEKFKVSCPVKHVRINASNTSIYDGSQVAFVKLSSYTRKSVSPSISIGASGRFGKKQAFLTGSLISQMAANLSAKKVQAIKSLGLR